MKCDILVLAALNEERAPFLSLLRTNSSTHRQYVGKHFTYEVFQLFDVVVAIPVMAGMGQLNSAITACKTLDDISPKFIMLLGIAGCMLDRGNGSLGDIAVSETIIDYEIQKIHDDAVEYRDMVYQCAPQLIRQIKAAELGDWHKGIEVPRPSNDGSQPRVVYGHVLSGNSVLASDVRKKELRAKHPKVVAIEMEAAGIATAATQYDKIESTNLLMVKSFTDWADGAKDDSWRGYCTVAIAHYAFNLIARVLSGYVSRLPGHMTAENEFVESSQRLLDCLAGTTPFPEECLELAAKSVNSQAGKEVLALRSGHYRVDLGTSYQFLLRASPFFRRARKIYATSLDTVSTFWTNPDNINEAKQYLKDQAQPECKACRLFVFSTAERAHYYSKVLDAHFNQYRDVFVTSMANYTQLLKNLLAPHKHEDYIRRDYAVLEYPSGAQFFAELSHRHLHFDPVDKDTQYVFAGQFMNLLDELGAELEPGDFSSKHQILKWNYRHANSPDWPKNLSDLFGKASDLLHIVGFDVPETLYEALRGKLSDLKYKAANALQSKYDIIDVRLRKRIFYSEAEHPYDGQTKGRLQLSEMECIKYILTMRFRSKSELLSFYSDPLHSSYRREVYSLLDDVVRQHLAEIESLITSNSPYTSLLHDLMEKAIAHRLFRLDFEDDEPFTDIVRSEPFQFPVP